MIKKLIPHWEDLYSNSPLDKFLKGVKSHFDNEEIIDDAVRQLHRFTQLEEMRKKGVISNNDYIQKQSEISTAAYEILNKINTEYLPILPVTAVAGAESGPQYAIINQQQIEEWRYMPNGNFKNCIGIKVEGDSMNPIYHDGDILICKKIALENIKESHTVVVVNTDNSIFLKKIKKNGASITLNSTNSDFKPFSLAVREIVEFWLVESKIK